MKTKTYRVIDLLILAMLLFGLPITAAAKSEKAYSVSIRNDQVFLDGKQLTKSASKKSRPVISNDKKKIVYVCDYKDLSIKLGVYDILKKTEKTIKIDQEYIQIMGIKWLSNRNIGILVHVNPSLDSYQTYDVITGKNLDNYFGYGFLFNKSNSSLIYIQTQPHFSSPIGEDKVMLNNSVLFKTDKKTLLDNVLYPSASFKRLAFFEYNIENERKSSIVILTIVNNKVVSKNKIAWNKDLVLLKWEKSESVLLIGNTAKYDLKTYKLIPKKVKIQN